MTSPRPMWFARLALLGAALSCAWIVPAAAQTPEDCVNYERLVALALHGFPGMEGKETFRNKKFTAHELAKPVPGFKSCELWVPQSLSDGDPSVVCDIMKSADIEPIEGAQTPELMKMWQKTMNKFANDMAQCLGTQADGPRPGKAKEGREVLRWYVFVNRPALSSTAEAAFALNVDQPVAGARLDRSNRIQVRLHADRQVHRELAASFSKQPPARVSVADFESFAGLRRGASVDDVLRLYGEPNEIGPSKDRSTLYYVYARRYGGGFSVSVDAASNKVESIRLLAPDMSDWLRRRGVKDLKINLLGLRRDEVVARLGKPQSVDKRFHNWEIKTASGSLLLSLNCSDDAQDICTQMRVNWL